MPFSFSMNNTLHATDATLPHTLLAMSKDQYPKTNTQRPKTFLLFLFASLPFLLGGQTNPANFPELRIGEWRQHLPWQRASYVTQSAQHVYFASEWAVAQIDKADRSPRFITKVEEASDAGIRLIRFNQTTGVLLIAYSNSNIDLWNAADGTVTNLPFIRRNLNIIGDRTIYDVAFEGKFAYLATGFGVVKLNLERGEVDYTVFTDVPVHAFSLFNNYLYAGTEEGLYRLPADDFNPADFGRWQLLGAAQGFPAGASVNASAVFNNRLYFGIGRSLYRTDGSSAELLATHPTFDVLYLTTEGAGLVIGWKKGFAGSIEYQDATDARSEISGPCQANSPFYAIEDGARKFWIADAGDDYRYYDHNTGQCDRFDYNSPHSHLSSEIAVGVDGAVYVATPGPASDLAAPFRQDGVQVFRDGQWQRWAGPTIPALVDSLFSYVDLWRVVAHPSQDKAYIGSWVGGLLEFEAGQYARRYTKENSILGDANESGDTRTAIGGLAFDRQENLWISNYNADAPIAVLKADGTMRNFSAAPARNLLQVAVDQSGYKWFVVAFNGGVLVYDSGSDLDSPADDRYRLLSTANSALPTNTVNCITVDLEGDVWVGTSQGVVSFECGSNVFEPSCTGRRRIVTVDDFNAYLLETEDVRAIAVDGANRKWFGTTNGVFVQSADALTQVARYTSTNSPLFDNNITDIAVNPKNGEVWIGTERGLLSLRGEATDGGRVNNPGAYAYPNPVRPNYDGPIAIYGLARDANIKITDVAGNLVYEGKALGGQAVWNGRDYLGRRVASGVYLVFATSAESFDAPDAIITKVVILN